MHKYALMFSGGRDSIVLLHVWKEKLNDTLVIWVNSGAAYPETQQMMWQIKKQVPHFLEIKSNQPKQIEENGYPSDVIPMSHTTIGQLVSGLRKTKIQSAFDCCNANLWKPAAKAIELLGIKTVVRGQRKEEGRTSPVRDGDVINGVTYLFPLESWTLKQVNEYVNRNNIVLPSYYQTEKTSRDCWSCTGYVNEQVDRINNLPEPLRNNVLARLKEIRIAVEYESKELNSLTKE